MISRIGIAVTGDRGPLKVQIFTNHTILLELSEIVV